MKFLVSSLLFSAASARMVSDIASYTFEQYVIDFGKDYSAEEAREHGAIFAQNVKRIMAHNMAGRSWTEGVNAFTDATVTELMAKKGISKSMLVAHKEAAKEARVPRTGAKPKPKAALPTSVDWRLQGVVTPVKDQGYCGSCWTFSATETLESHLALATGTLFTLSEQEFVSCVPNPDSCGGTGGCAGATMELAFDYAMANGLVTEWTTPYTSYKGQDGACTLTKASPARVGGITGYTVLPSNDYEALLEAVATVGPIAITVDASKWSSYSGGVFNGCNQASPELDHGVVLVGYGSDAGMDYWLVRNSWGPTWGENGYIRLARSSDESSLCGVDVVPSDGVGCAGGPSNVTVCGTCGILYDTSYPTGSFLA
jgi:cathepsin L